MSEDEPMGTDISPFHQHTLLFNRHEETYDPVAHTFLLDAKNTVKDQIINLMVPYSTYYFGRKSMIEEIVELLEDCSLKDILLEIQQEEHIGRWSGEVLPGLDSEILEEQRTRQKRFEQIWSEFSKNVANKKLSDIYTQFIWYCGQLDETKIELKEKSEKYRGIKEKCDVVEQLTKSVVPTSSFSHFPQSVGPKFDDVAFQADSRDQSAPFKRSCDLNEDAPSSNKKMRFTD